MSKRSRRGNDVSGESFAAGRGADQNIRDEIRDPSAPSRTAKKKASQSLRRLGEQLIAAPRGLLVGLQLPEQFEDAIVEARSITSMGARRRQTQFVGKLMRRLDDDTLEAIRAALALRGLGRDESV
ncbi:MAG TPA: ribosome biogenesis factor YjgA [Gammaproteobacteria bacterium]|jgi:ribosome-associated protein